MKKNKINKYISLEASESDSEEESEDLNTDVIQRPVTNYIDIAKRIEEKYAQFDEEEEEEEEEDFEEEEEIKNYFLPQKSSPRLFLVRVKMGKEKDISLRILQNNTKICSIIAKDGLKGYLYIEAFQKQQVLDAFENIRGINKNKICVVPQNEMIEAISFINDYKHIEFGRLKKGKYKGDLVQVIEGEGDMIKVRVIPRINNIKKLFDPKEYKNEVSQNGDNTFIYKRDVYCNGYLIKEILKSSIDLDVEPNFDELEQFNIRKKFDIGDKVKVTRGEMIGLKGVIKSSINQMSTFVSNNKQYEILSNFLDKYYEIGEEVCYGSENGVITNIKDGLYFIAINNFTEEVCARVDQIRNPIPFTKEIIRKDKSRASVKRDRLINRQVQIKMGKYKGYIGVVKDVYMNKCRVQLSSNLKFVSVNKDELVEASTKIPDISLPRRSFSSIVNKTPAYEPETFSDYNFKQNTSGFDYSDIACQGALICVNSKNYVVESVSDNKFVTKEGEFDCNTVDFVMPEKEDHIIIMQGKDRGKNAILLEIDKYSKNAVVKIINGNIKNVPLGVITKRD